MTLLCIPVPRLVSCTFSTIPICPFLIQRIFPFTCLIIRLWHLTFRARARAGERPGTEATLSPSFCLRLQAYAFTVAIRYIHGSLVPRPFSSTAKNGLGMRL